MNLVYFTLCTSGFLGLLGLFLTFKSFKAEEVIRKFLRSQKASILLLAIGLFWFLFHHVQNLGEADFGEYKFIIGLIGVFIAVSSYFFINDFLAVRALCILLLFYSRLALDSAFLQEPQSRLFLVTVIYFIVMCAIYFGAWPYRLRDFLNWLYGNSKRSILLGVSFICYSLVLLGAALSY
jgi:hypothetical protein